MRNETFEKAVSMILKRDKRYPRAAYEMMPVILDYTVRKHNARQRSGDASELEAEDRHVTGQQLAEGFRDYLLDEYGPFAEDIVNDLNLHATIDIGHLLFNLISVGCFGKTPEDRLEDFDQVYDFEEAFVKPFAVQNPEFYETQDE